MVLYIILFYVGAFVALSTGISFMRAAKGAVHEIEGLICLLMSAVLFGSGAVVHAGARVRMAIERLQTAWAAPAPNAHAGTLQPVSISPRAARSLDLDTWGSSPTVTAREEEMRETLPHEPPIEFVDNDQGYLSWLQQHPSGFVLNL